MLSLFFGFIFLSGERGHLTELERFSRFGTNQGLGAISATCVLKGPNGWLWIGTTSGLYRFDGLRFEPLPQGPIQSTSITALCFDPDGTLWFGTLAGLGRLAKSQQLFLSQPAELVRNTGDWAITHIGVTSDQSIWVGTESGLFRGPIKDPARLVKVPELGAARINAICPINQNLWVATAAQLWTVNQNTSQSFSCQIPLSALAAKNGKLVCGTATGSLFLFDPELQSFAEIPTEYADLGKIFSLLWDPSRQTLWVGANVGLLRLEPNQQTRFVESSDNPDGLPGNSIMDLDLDAQGHLWLGTSQGGLAKFYVDQRLWGFHQVLFESEPSKDDSDVNTFYEDSNGLLWVATLGRIYHWNQHSNEVFSVPIKDVHFRYALFFFEDEHGLWTGGGGGLYQLHNSEFKCVLENKQLKKMLSAGNGSYFLAGLGQGLMIWHPEQGVLRTYAKSTEQGLPNDHIFDMKKDSQDRLWLGTRGGLAVLEPGSQSQIRSIPYRSEETGDVVPIECQSLLFQDNTGWLSTYGQGLFTFNLAEHAGDIHLTKSALPFPTPNLMSLVQDSQNQIWISSLLGLYRLNKNQTGFSAFFQADGLQENEFNGGAFAALNSGELIVGGINGFNRFDPQALPETLDAPRLVINHMEAWRSGRKHAIEPNPDGPIQLDYQDYNIQCGFSLLEFRNPELVHYAYYLAGSKINSWVPLGKDAELNLPLIPPGHYTLHVRAISDRGLNPQEITREIYVKPPFWETTWFRLLLLAVLAILTHLIYILGKRLAHIVRSWRKSTFFGDFELLEVLGKGGMGTVYRARKRHQKTEVALKILDQRIQNPDRIKRFIREGLICESIIHPNVVKVFEKGSSHGKLYFSMELFRGSTLTSLIQEGQWTVTLSLALADALLDILKSIHELGIQHRDLKPDNIMILNSSEDWPEDYAVLLQTMRNRIKLLDFGLAKAAGLDTITQTGDMFGTISYLPPETLRGEAASGYVADFYAFGIVCYEMLVGKRPFEGEDFVSLVYRVLNENPRSPHQHNQKVPPDFSNWVMALIAKDINHRIHDGVSIRAGLAPIVRQAKTQTFTVQPTSS